MADTIFSPDGKWMWIGSEWIPAPPTSTQALGSTINLKDSAMSGDIHITQNNAGEIAAAMVQALERLGFSSLSSPTELTSNERVEVEQVLAVSEELAKNEFTLDPNTELSLAVASRLIGQYKQAINHCESAMAQASEMGDKHLISSINHTLGSVYRLMKKHDLAEKHYEIAINLRIENGKAFPGDIQGLAVIALNKKNYVRARELFHEVIRLEMEDERVEDSNLSNAYRGIAVIEQDLGNYDLAEQFNKKSLDWIERFTPDYLEGRAYAYSGLAWVALKRGLLDEANNWNHKSFEINLQLNNKAAVIYDYFTFADIAYQKGDFEEQRRMEENAKKIQRELGLDYTNQ